MESRDLDVLISIDNKVDEVRNRIHSIELTQTRMESDLKYHIKRTDILEGKIMEVDEKVRPVQTVKDVLLAIFKTVTFVAAIVGSMYAILRNFR